MKSYCVRANDRIEFQGQHFFNDYRKNTFLGVWALKIKSCPPLQLIVLWVWGQKYYWLSKLFLFTSLTMNEFSLDRGGPLAHTIKSSKLLGHL